MRYDSLDFAKVLGAFDDEVSRVMRQGRIWGRSLAAEAARSTGTLEATMGLAKSYGDDLVIGQSLAREFAVATKSLASADSTLLVRREATSALAEAVSEKAAGLRMSSEAFAQITVPDWSATRTVFDQLNGMKALGADLVSLQKEQASLVLRERERLDQYLGDSLLTLDWGSISRTLGPIDELKRATGAMLDSYKLLSESVTLVVGELIYSLDGFPRIEAYAHANLLRGLSRGGPARPKEREQEKERDQEQEEESRLKEEVSEQSSTTLHSLLTAHHPDLAHMWHGAKEAFRSGNPDYVRQYSVSQRELLLQLLRRAAPDGEVRKWTNDPEHFFSRNTSNQPTWRARILYLCAKADRKRFGHFAVADTGSALEVYYRLNRGVHRVEPDFSPREVTDLQIRADNLILFVVLLSLEARR